MNKKLLASAIASALVIGVGAEAADFKASGQVSRAIVVPDDALGNETQFVDNDISGSRFRFKGTQDIGSGVKAGFRLEAQFQSNNSATANGGSYKDPTGNHNGDDSIDLRYQDVYFSGSFGKFSLGKGDGAGNDSTESDLSGTYMIAAANNQDLYGGYIFNAANVGVANTDSGVGDVYGNTDAYSRNNRFRYDSNNFGGFSFAASYGQQEVMELSAKFAGGTDIKYVVQGFVGTIGEALKGAGDGDDRVGISGSVLLANGLNFTASYSEKDSDLASAQDRENMWVKVGYKMGKHAVAVDYGETEDSTDTATVSEADTKGISYVFAPAKGVELYAGYREYGIDGNTDTDPEFVTVGSRVKF
jgi:predicted porin